MTLQDLALDASADLPLGVRLAVAALIAASTAGLLVAGLGLWSTLTARLAAVARSRRSRLGHGASRTTGPEG